MASSSTGTPPLAGPGAGMSLIAELKRRKVFKVGAAYLVVAWLAVQAASIAFPTFDAPLWALRVFILVCLLGFPLALVMAWIFDATPEGMKVDTSTPGNKRVFAGAAILIVLALGWYFHGQPAFRKGDVAIPAAIAVPAAPSVDPRSIAVLPFLNMSDDKNNEYFSDGISEELLNVLVRVNGFNVASRTSSFAFKGREIGTPEIARQLKVRYVLEGSVRKQGDQLRITAQLIDASNDRHVLSETYDRKLADIFKIQDEIANAIVTAVTGAMGTKTEAPAVTVKADTANLNAYDSYLKARELFLARSDLKESARLFEQSVKLDPNFARGWEGLAAVYSVMPSWGIQDRDYYLLAASAAKRALDLDQSLSMAWATLGTIKGKQLPADFAGSNTLLDRAIAIDPRNSTAYLWRATNWFNLGFLDRALADENECLRLDPHYGNCKAWKALTLLDAGDDAGALAMVEQNAADAGVQNHQPSFVVPILRRGDKVGAILVLDSMGAKPELNRILIAALSHPEAPRPNYSEIERRFGLTEDDPFLENVGKASLCLWLQDFDCLDSMEPDSSDMAQWDTTSPGFRNSAGFKKLLERLNVPDYWRKVGYPPQCHAVGAGDFTCDAPTLKAAK